MADARLRRSMLMTPGNRPDRLRKAFGCGADDLAALPLAAIDSIMVPKGESAEGLLHVQRVLE